MNGSPGYGKVVRLVSQTDPASSLVCRGCGSVLHGDGVCRRCAVRLLDLALSSTPEVFPRLLEYPLGQVGADQGADPIRYGHYQVCQLEAGAPWELGRGAMGITYKAVDTHLGCTVALKIINGERLAGARGRERFLREARAAAQIRHPNIAGIFHLGPEASDCFYAMEYIEGETLDAYVRRKGALPTETALNITCQAARGLRAAHEQRFVHRDIKPANLMLVGSDPAFGADSLVKVIDFGLVKASVEDEATEVICRGYFAGTPYYASPEQLSGGVVDARSDIFSLGMCLGYMLAGGVPACMQNSTADAGQIQPISWAESKLRHSTPELVRLLLQSMTAEDPAARPQTAASLLLQIGRCLAAWRPPVQSPLRRRGRGAALVMGVLSVAACGGWLLKTEYMKRDQQVQPPSSVVGSSSQLEARVLYAKGNEYRFKGTQADNQRAIELYGRALALDPGFADAHAALASAYLQAVARFSAPRGQLDEALTSAQRAIALEPNSAAAYTALGEIRTVQGLHWSALSEFYRALGFNAQYPPAMRGFSLLWSMVGQPQRGLPWAKAAVRMEAANTASWNAAANATVDLCMDDEAEESYRQCLEINPTWMVAHCGLLHLHLLQGDFARARKDCAVAESIDPHPILLQTLKAQVALFGGEYEEAESLYSGLLARNRGGYVHYFSSISYLSALGFLRCRANDFSQGQALLEEAAALQLNDSEGPQAIYDLAAIRAVQGRKEEATALLERAISAGWMDYRATQLDPRFQTLRDQVPFRRLLEDLREHIGKMRVQAQELCAKPVMVADYPVDPPRG